MIIKILVALAGYFNDLIEFDTVTEVWSPVEVAGTLPRPRSCPGLTVVGSLLVIFGGSNDAGARLD